MVAMTTVLFLLLCRHLMLHLPQKEISVSSTSHSLLFLALRFCFVFEWINECLSEESDTKNWIPIYENTNVHLE